MRVSAVVTVVLSVCGVVHASYGAPTVMESLRSVPDGWVEESSADAEKRLHFRIAVAQPNQALFEQTVLDVSTPGHPRYGQHLKREELKELLRPREESTTAILQWLNASGIASSDIEDKGEWINYYATVAQAEQMLDTRFFTYRSTVDTTVRKTRTLHYSVPADLHAHIDMIQPTTRFGQIRPQRNHVLKDAIEVIGPVRESASSASIASTSRIAATNCNLTITPTCLKQLYNFGDFTAENNTVLGVSGFLSEYARYADLRKFIALYAPWATGTSFTWTSVLGGTLDQNSTEDSVEANLDVDYTVSLSYPIANNFYSTPGRGPLVPDLDQPDPADNENEPYLDYFTWLLEQDDCELPSVLTTSYGEDEQSVPLAYSLKVCDLIGQLGARGVSVLFSSGDTGVGSACQTNDGTNTTRFLPIFPASCPYVTSVGGTYQIGPEKAVSFSSGGFSDRWARPAWQDAAVTAYLDKLGDRWDGLYNRTGRGFPDVAAQAYRFHVINRGLDTLVGGTSAAAPTFAAVIANLNSARLSAGLSALGWLNPWLYANATAALNDITVGGSRGCTGIDSYSGLTTPYVPYASWNATPGWDPVTGLGTPDFQQLLELALD